MLSFFLAGFLVRGAEGQVLPNFPFSSQGIGELTYNPGGQISGMGNTASALRGGDYLNLSNPASLTGLLPQTAIMELGGKGTSANIRDYLNTASSSDFTFNRFVLGFKVNDWMGTSFGIQPFSRVEYQIVQNLPTPSGNQINSTFEGNGGLNEAFWSNGFRIGKHLSLGVRASFLFGSVNHIETVGFPQANPLITTTQQTYYRNFQLGFGGQAYGKISKDWAYSLGATFSNQRDLRAQNSLEIISGSDTLTNSITSNNFFTLPTSYRGGLALIYQNKVTIGFDYAYDDWHHERVNNNNVSLVNSSRFGAGIMYQPAFNSNTYGKDLLQRIYFEGGFNYNNSYLQINAQQVRDVNLSLGTGLYNLPHTLSLSLGFEIGQQSTPNSGLISENYLNFYCTFILRDIWFVKRKFY